MLDRRGAKFVSQGLKHDFTRGAVVGKHPHLDQAMGIERLFGFFFDGIGQAVATNHDDRVQVMGCGAVVFAVGGVQLYLGHGAIIGLNGKQRR